jgi:hypothetical protein
VKCRPKRRAPIAPGLPLVLAALASSLPRPGAAIEDEELELYVAEMLVSDSNVFRLPDIAIAAPAAADPGDRYRHTALGAALDLPVAEQRLTGVVELTRDRYDEFPEIDYDGHRGDLAWLWQVGRRASGQLAHRDESVRGSFSNLQGGVATRQPNLIDSRETFADAAFLVAPGFELGGAVGERRQSNSAAELVVNDLDEDRSALTFSYIARSGNRAGLRFESWTGHLPVLQEIGSAAVDNSYEQRASTVVVEWSQGEQSRVDFTFGKVSRRYEQAVRDYSDWTYSLTWRWQPVARFTLATLAADGISEREEVNVGFVVAERIQVSPEFRVRENLSVTAWWETSDRQHLGDPALLAPGGAPVLETVRTTGMGVNWTPTRYLRFALAWRSERRVSNLLFADYAAEVASLEVRASL